MPKTLYPSLEYPKLGYSLPSYLKKRSSRTKEGDRQVKKTRLLLAILCGTLFAALAFSTGCQSNTPSDEPTYADEAFLVDLGKGLDRRWDLSDEMDQNGGTTTAEQIEELIQAELDSIEKYAGEKFEDTKLQELAISYINALKDTKDASDAFANQNDINSYQKWQTVYNNRVMILKELLENYEVKTAEKHDSVRSGLLSAGSVAQQNADTEAALQVIADSIQFTFTDNGYGNITGAATATNNSGINFASAQFDVQLYDENGVRLETNYASVQNWNDGETVNLDIYVTSQVIPASVKIVPSYYEVQN